MGVTTTIIPQQIDVAAIKADIIADVMVITNELEARVDFLTILNLGSDFI